VKQLKEQINQLIDQERIIPEEILAELTKCLSHCALLNGAPDNVDSFSSADTRIFTTTKNWAM